MNIGIIVAMSKELELLKPMLEGTTQTVINGKSFLSGTMDKHKVTVMQCGIGKVNAAIGTVEMINNFHPSLIINTGVAGGMNGVNVMDLVVGSQVCYHDVWCGFDNTTQQGQVQGLPLYFDGDSTVISKIDDNDSSVHCGLIVSGDQFIDSGEQVAKISEAFPQALAVDMESGAIAQVCHVMKTPFVSMRVISDSPGAGHNNTRQYYDFWTEAPAHTLAAVRQLLSKLD